MNVNASTGDVVNVLLGGKLKPCGWVLRHRNAGKPRQRQARCSKRNIGRANRNRTIGQRRIRNVAERIQASVDCHPIKRGDRSTQRNTVRTNSNCAIGQSRIWDVRQRIERSVQR